jgi:hypothetical protein
LTAQGTDPVRKTKTIRTRLVFASPRHSIDKLLMPFISCLRANEHNRRGRIVDVTRHSVRSRSTCGTPEYLTGALDKD